MSYFLSMYSYSLVGFPADHTQCEQYYSSLAAKRTLLAPRVT